MKFLVTGGLGFIGSNMVDFLVEKGHTVVVVDDLSTGDPSYQNPKAIYVNAHITDLDTMQGLSQNCDAIFHFAAWARLQRSINDPIGTNNANVVGTLTLLEAARRNNIKKFIFSSSSSVYGDQKEPQMTEEMDLNPLHPYALQKWVGEKYCELYTNLFKLQTVRLRYFNVYGYRQILQGDYALVIGKFLEAKKKDLKATIYGDGEQTRAYTHISDVVKANWAAFEYMAKQGDNYFSEAFNIGTDVETSVNRIAELVGVEAEHINPNPRGNFEERRKCANYSKAFTKLNWKPEVTIEKGIEMLCQ